MAPPLVFPPYAPLYQHLTTSLSRKGQPLSPAQECLCGRIASMFAQQTFSEREARQKLVRIFSPRARSWIILCVSSVLEAAFFPLLLECTRRESIVKNQKTENTPFARHYLK